MSVRTIENIFIRYNGASYEIPFAKVDVGEDLNAGQIKAAVERYLDLAPGTLADYQVDQYPTSIVVRPEAKFGL